MDVLFRAAVGVAVFVVIPLARAEPASRARDTGVAREPGFTESVAQALAPHLSSHVAELSAWESQPWRHWPQLAITLPGGGWLLMETPEFLIARLHDEVPWGENVVTGRSTMPSRSPARGKPSWTRREAAGTGAITISVETEEGVKLTYTATSRPGRVDILCELVNGTASALPASEEVMCGTITQNSAFHSIDVRTSHFFSAGRYLSWDAALEDITRLWKPGMEERQGWHWLLAPLPGRGLTTPSHPQYARVTAVADAGLLVQDARTDAKQKAILVAEPASSVFKNCWSGCVHANPAHPPLPPGGTHRATNTLFLATLDDPAAVLGPAVARATAAGTTRAPAEASGAAVPASPAARRRSAP